MTEKTAVLVGTDEDSGLPLYRVFKAFYPDRKNLTIQTYYDEYLLTPNGLKANVKENKYYIVKNLNEGEIVNNFDLPTWVSDENFNQIPNPDLTVMEADFLGFDNWFNYDIGVFPNGTTLAQVIEGAIDAALAAIPIGAKSGWIITQSN